MIENSLVEVIDRFRFQFFRRIFDQVHEREGSLSAMEAFAVEVIDLLDCPTIGQFADFLGISQSNATYKVNSLIRKGYLVRQNSEVDRREYHLVLSEKYRNYMNLLTSYEKTVMNRMRERLPQEDLETFDRVLRVMADELMPESDMIKKDKETT